MSTLDLDTVKQALSDAGFEIYRSAPDEIRLAERVRYHIMDSGVCAMLSDSTAVRLTCRAQRSDFPSASEASLLKRVRDTVGVSLTSRGFAESQSDIVEVRNPSDESSLLDVWYEISYEKKVASLDELLSELAWALSVDKYVSRT